ncbi:MAG TPA: AGE family epimerase/isomerase [Bacteroidales bacterium]|nr:AGE family epimerase/isomerase [Bacteroidales bacterium]HOM41034.1 AGE family epimerase/isomerase [Bacteroidales bacterium]HPP92116.1 AGE family epimerase/isomerase [Bacteroidales bacterium]HRR15601.1 AGE family epimerase/isomerase [Bacteroidales bacterium]HRT47165.1 AGE family epimerase/isomerase [Bacteroidales bacterium]
MKKKLEQLSEQYKNELLDKVIPFWENFSIDHQYGGFLTCLDREGKVYDTDKFVWLQARQIWMFSFLYNNVEKKHNWLKIAEDGAEFLTKYGRDQSGSWYFSLTREGKPLVAPYNIFSDCFAAMAFAELYKATSKEKYKRIATYTFNNILKRLDNPKGIYNKSIRDTRDLKNLSIPMILCNLILIMDELISQDFRNELAYKNVKNIMELFYDPVAGIIRENICADGSFSNTFEGRLINPGHGIEAMWFIMDIAELNNDKQLSEKSVKIVLNTLEMAWDREYGGIYYFMDLRGYPLQQLEWNQKLWWVHIESLISLIKGYYYTGSEDCLKWFIKLHEYVWSHFPDPRYGEWWGYLDRRGEVLIPLKGGKWKGCYHVPRGLYQIWKTIEKIKAKN